MRVTAFNISVKFRFTRSQRTMFSCTQHVVFKYIQIWPWFCVFITSLVEAWFKYIMMLCPLNVVLKLNRFVNVTCSFNIRGEYFKAQYFSIPLACCFFTNQLTGFFVPLHNVTSCENQQYRPDFVFRILRTLSIHPRTSEYMTKTHRL